MKLYYVSLSWVFKGHRKSRGCSGCVIAESREDAIEKFKAKATFPEDIYIDIICFEEDGVVITNYK